MASLTQLTALPTLWKTFSEIDINTIREEAQATPRLAVIGAADKTAALQRILQTGPRSNEQVITALPSFTLPLSATDLNTLAGYDLRIVLPDNPEQLNNDGLRALFSQRAATLVVQDPLRYGSINVEPSWNGGRAGAVHSLVIALSDDKAIKEDLLPGIVRLLPERAVAAGRAYAGLRPAVANYLIQSTSKANAGYAAGTGVAEMVPLLGLPFAMADVYILTKNQIIMAYKLGLLMGEEGTLAELAPKVAGVVGAGFVWRQIAREIVGFLPLGFVLKTAIAYAGTIATGQAVYHYFTTGEKLNTDDIRAIFNQALTRGKDLGRSLKKARRK
ncbi:MAG: hypothetical protein ABTQ73_00250 [Caldilineales bacterium]